MITAPDRLSELAKAIENREPVDLRRIRALQSLDLVQAGRQFAEQAIRSHEETDEQLQKNFLGPALDL